MSCELGASLHISLTFRMLTLNGHCTVWRIMECLARRWRRRRHARAHGLADKWITLVPPIRCINLNARASESCQSTTGPRPSSCLYSRLTICYLQRAYVAQHAAFSLGADLCARRYCYSAALPTTVLAGDTVGAAY